MASVVGITDEGKPAWADFGNKAPSKFSVFLSAEAQFPPPPMADPATSQRYWNIAKPLIIELCNQWTPTKKYASCTPDTLCTYLRDMYHTALPGEPPLPTASDPTAYAWAIESRLNGYQSPGLAALEYRGIKRHSEQGNEAERRVLARSRVEEVEEVEEGEDWDVVGNGASPSRELPSSGTGNALHGRRESGGAVGTQERESSPMDITATASPASGAGGDACSGSMYSKSDRLRSREGSGSPLCQTQDGAGVEFDRLLRQLCEDADPFVSPVGSPGEDGSLQSISDGDSPFTPPPPPWQPSEWDYFGRQSHPGSPGPLFVPQEIPFEPSEPGSAASHASHAAYPTVRPLELSLADITQADIDAAVDSWRLPDNVAQVAADTAAAVPRGSPPSRTHAPDLSPAERDSPSPPRAPGGDNPSAEEKAAARWRGFRARSGPADVTATWRQLSTTQLDKAPLGWAGADRLMQMVFNIASPAALVGVKHLLQHVRTEQACRPRAPVGGLAAAFTAGDWHATNEHASRIGQALAAWCIHHRRQQLQQEGHPDPMGQMVQEIQSQLPDGQRDRSKIEEKTREWNKRAWPWNQLVQLAGSPNILCFLPQDVGYFSGQEGSCMTHYRKLTKAHFEAMAQVFQEHRLPFFQSVPASFFEIFLYNQSPPGRFAIEDWTDYDILHEPLDSVRFDRAFQPTAKDASVSV